MRSRVTVHGVRFVAIAVFGLWLSAGPVVAADDVAATRHLLDGGRAEAALERADRYLSDHPRDPRMRFEKAIILTRLKRPADATKVLELLVQDYPDLAEPYNNLAAVYAAAGEYAKAGDALEHAIRIDPAYAIARENLGDVYAMLSARSYAAALRLDGNQVRVAEKLAQLRRVVQSVSPAASSTAPAASALR